MSERRPSGRSCRWADCGLLRGFTEARTKSLWLWGGGRRPEYVGDDLEQKIFGPGVPTIWRCASQALIELDEAVGG